jgi:hypothetical protein
MESNGFLIRGWGVRVTPGAYQLYQRRQNSRDVSSEEVPDVSPDHPRRSPVSCSACKSRKPHSRAAHRTIGSNHRPPGISNDSARLSQTRQKSRGKSPPSAPLPPLGQSSISRRRQCKTLSNLAFFFQAYVRTAWAQVDSGTMARQCQSQIKSELVCWDSPGRVFESPARSSFLPDERDQAIADFFSVGVVALQFPL